MTIYEFEDFDKIWDGDHIKVNRAIDKLKSMRRGDDCPTAKDLQKWFELDDNEGGHLACLLA